MWAVVRADLMANVFKPPGAGAAYWVKVLGKLLITPQVQVVVLFRIASALAHTPLRPLAFVIRAFSVTLGGTEIHPDARIGPGLALVHSTGVVIGGGVVIGSNCRISQGVTLGEMGRGVAHAERDGSPTVGDWVTIGTNAVVLGPCHLGDRCIIGANSVVTKDIGADLIAAGAPAKVIRERDPSASRSIPHPPS